VLWENWLFEFRNYVYIRKTKHEFYLLLAFEKESTIDGFLLWEKAVP
jgi:hypothetical protein